MSRGRCATEVHLTQLKKDAFRVHAEVAPYELILAIREHVTAQQHRIVFFHVSQLSTCNFAIGFQMHASSSWSSWAQERVCVSRHARDDKAVRGGSGSGAALVVAAAARGDLLTLLQR